MIVRNSGGRHQRKASEEELTLKTYGYVLIYVLLRLTRQIHAQVE